MTKSLMLSIQPKHLVNILNGNKTLELRKTVPKDFKGWVYIYCSRGKDILEYSFLGYRTLRESSFYNNGIGMALNGKIVARFWFDEYTKYEYQDVSYPQGYEDYDGNFIDTTEFVEGYPMFAKEQNTLCLSYYTIENYGNKKPLYTWHIKKT